MKRLISFILISIPWLLLSSCAGPPQIEEPLTIYNVGSPDYPKTVYDSFLERYQEKLSQSKANQELQAQAGNLNMISHIYRVRGHNQEALDYAQQALKLFRQLGNKVGEGVMLNAMGEIYAGWSQDSRALDYYEQAFELFE